MITVNKQSLNSLLAGMVAYPSVLEDTNIVGISLDSRHVDSAYLFLALSVDKQQRLNCLKQAISAGASVVLYDKDNDLASAEITELAQAGVAAYAINNLADKTGEIAARFYGHPSLALTIIAVTGTNGKTSVSQFIAQSLESLGLPCGIVGTLGIGRINGITSTGMTTPDLVTLQGALADFCQQGINYAVIEASSHALQQGRLNNVAIDVAVLTNLSRDHLDYHKNMDDYATAKAQLFNFPSVKVAIINSGDDFGQRLIEHLSETGDMTVLTYSKQSATNADFYANNCQTTQQGLRFDLVYENNTRAINSTLLGQFNIDNLLATTASLSVLDIPVEKIINVVEQCHSVKGRMQAYGSAQQTQLIIDFAHTPDALTQALTSLRAHVPTSGQLWCVFGCGGDRDAGKRPEMGRCAEQYADNIVLTDDNPRSEIPSVIVRDILSGISSPEKIHVEHDRKKAISYAVSHANSADIVLVAGKGHEKYQEISGVKQPFSDADTVIEMLAANDKYEQAMRVGEC